MPTSPRRPRRVPTHRPTTRPHARQSSRALDRLEPRTLLFASGGPFDTGNIDLGTSAVEVVVADFNGDFSPDLAVINDARDGVVISSRDASTGEPTPYAEIAAPAGIHSLQLVDANADGQPDLMFFDPTNHRLVVHTSTASGFEEAGGFQFADTATGAWIHNILLPLVGEPIGELSAPPPAFDGPDGDGGDGTGDGTGSGDPDDGTVPRDRSFRGDPWFIIYHESTTTVELQSGVNVLASLGLEPDDLLPEPESDEPWHGVAWPITPGEYADVPEGIEFIAGAGLGQAAVADFDNNGHRDVAVLNQDDGTMTVFFGDFEVFEYMHNRGPLPSDWTPTTQTIDLGDTPSDLNPADVNHDGYHDLVIGLFGDNQLAVVPGSAGGMGEPTRLDLAGAPVQIHFCFPFLDPFADAGDAGGVSDDTDGDGAPDDDAHPPVGPSYAIVFTDNDAFSIFEFTGEALQFVGEVELPFDVESRADGDHFLFVPGLAPDGTFVGSLAYLQAGEGTMWVMNGFNPCDCVRDIVGPGDPGGTAGDLALPAPTSIDLLPESDTGASDSDDITSLDNTRDRALVFEVTGSISTADWNDYFLAHPELPSDQRFYLNLWEGGRRIGLAEVELTPGADADWSVEVTTDGFTVLRPGARLITANLSAGTQEDVPFILGALAEPLEIRIELPFVEFDPNFVPGDERALVIRDENGDSQIRLFDDEGNEQVINLGEVGDAPDITGAVRTFNEPKGGGFSRYAAGYAPEGLILFTGLENGEWGSTNLTDAIPGAEPFSQHDLDTYETPWGNLNIVGLNDAGDLIIYWQDGGLDEANAFRWNFTNISDAALPDGQTTPDFASGLEPYVTPWGGTNVAGLDENGHLRVVWWAPGLETWVSSDLTELLGTSPMVGEIAAYVTPWGGLNISGTDADGNLVVAWWAPGMDTWQLADLGAALGAPTFVQGSVRTFVSDRGDLYVAGLAESTAEPVLFSWSLDTQTWTGINLVRSELTENLTGEVITTPSTAELVGAVSGYASDTGAVTLFTTDAFGVLYEFEGQAGDAASFSFTRLDIA